jgi:glucan biosynthesis protein C
VPLALIILILEPFFPDEHDWEDFFFYFGFFVLGYIFYADKRFTVAVRRDGKLLAFAAIVGVIALFGVSIVTGVSYSSQPGTAEFILSRVFWALVAWSWTLLILSTSMRFLDFTNSRLEYLREAQLPIFVLHQPVIIVIAFFVVQWDAGILPKLLLVVGGSFLVTFGINELFIRRIKPVRALFGMKPRYRKEDNLT